MDVYGVAVNLETNIYTTYTIYRTFVQNTSIRNSGFLELIFARLPQFKNLQELELSWSNRTKVPREIFLCTTLRSLDLGSNAFEALPPEIGQLVNLKCLIVNRNSLRRLPPEIGNLRELTTLMCNHNRLETLPVEIMQLTKLERLALAYNKFTVIPKELEQFDRLERLSVDLHLLPQVSLRMCLLLRKNNLAHWWYFHATWHRWTAMFCYRLRTPVKICEKSNLDERRRRTITLRNVEAMCLFRDLH